MKKIGFDNDKYLAMQSEHIKNRIAQFGGKLYLEFGGKLFDDYHASRVLPGFAPDSKVRMLCQMADQAEIVIVISAGDIEKNKVRSDLGITYDVDVLRLIDAFRGIGLYVGSVVITQYAGQAAADAFKRRLQALVDDCAGRACAAEQAGAHDRAVRLALEAQRLKRYLSSSADVSASLEAAHAVATANRALTGILQASGSLADRAAQQMDAAALGAAQVNLMNINGSMELMMEQSEMLLDGLGAEEICDSEAGEALLQEILHSQRRDRRSRLLEDTNRQLDRLRRTRDAENREER